LLYDSDYYGDDLPFWMKVRKTDGSDANHLVVPYTLDCNDMRFACRRATARRAVLPYMRDSFDVLYAEGDPQGDRPKMMSIGMHCRCWAPGPLTALQRFSTTSSGTRRLGVPAHRHRPPLDRHPPLQGLSHVAYAGQLNRASPAEAELMLDGLYEHSPWIAARACRRGPSARWPSSSTPWPVLAEAGGTPSWPDPRPPGAGGQGHGGKTLTAESTGEQRSAA
jgi:hypothetical protein